MNHISKRDGKWDAVLKLNERQSAMRKYRTEILCKILMKIQLLLKFLHYFKSLIL